MKGQIRCGEETGECEKSSSHQQGLSNEEEILFERHISQRDADYECWVVPPDLGGDEIVVPWRGVDESKDDVEADDRQGRPGSQRDGKAFAATMQGSVEKDEKEEGQADEVEEKSEI